MANGSILCVDANKEVPTLLLSKLLQHNTTTGAVFVVEDQASVMYQQLAPGDMEQIQAMRKAFMGNVMYMSFHNHGPTMHEDDSQPYIVLADNEDQVVMVAFLEGDFSKFAHQGSSREPAWFALENVIRPRVEQFYRLAKGDMALVMEELRKESIKDEFGDCIIDRGMIALIPNDGAVFCIDVANDKGFTGDWGWCSNAYGYTETPVVEEPKELTPQEKLAQFSAKKKIIKPPATTVPRMPPIAPEKPVDALKVSTVGDTTIIDTRLPGLPMGNADLIKKDGPLMWAPEMGLSSNETKKLYKINSAVGLPQNWRQRPMVPVLPSRAGAIKKELERRAAKGEKGLVVKSFQDVGAAMGLSKAIDFLDKEKAQAPTDVTVETFEKNVEPEHIQSSPIVSAKTVALIHKEFMTSPSFQKWTAGKTPTLEEIIAIENKLPNVYEVTGMQIDKPWTDEMITEFILKYPDAAKLMFKTLIIEKLHHAADKALERKFSDATAPKKKEIIRPKTA